MPMATMPIHCVKALTLDRQIRIGVYLYTYLKATKQCIGFCREGGENAGYFPKDKFAGEERI